MSTVAELIYFQPKDSVKPEDPSSEEGRLLLEHFQTTKHQSGYHSSAWGRTVEDSKTIVWVNGKTPTPAYSRNLSRPSSNPTRKSPSSTPRLARPSPKPTPSPRTPSRSSAPSRSPAR
ncbi:predicted protein [Aspergillus terreus NIH2624]|uniref:Uncharacterized protein n=1 Tax=Aspergillus terreus (strain NIH 2624 / FGSC A1156) TaxID=341663 RepID=Q0CJX4_ASPTN|nr:uncharacterized protein ATEG_06010 [Aspergillus terreus NIH2624]EAU33771.1 predicted protein [Aspergillus terreus NIH2624]